ncbi:MAG: signal peptidase II [Acidobacteriota bacterium]
MTASAESAEAQLEGDGKPSPAAPRPLRGKAWIFAAILGGVVALDQWTKAWALDTLAPAGRDTIFAGGWLPLTLHFNRGGLWGLGSGTVSRWAFAVAAVVALALILYLYREVDRRTPLRLLALPAIGGGAIGNLIDRLRWDRGVIDFLGPFDLHFMQWPIFNVADMAISCCTIVLMISLFLDPTGLEPAQKAAPVIEE